jgi:carbamate kinase
VLSSAVLNVPGNKGACTIVTETLVDSEDPAFANPTKPVGAMYTKEEADEKAASLGWALAPDGDMFRRVVPSPQPQSILQIEQIKALLSAQEGLVICCGGGGVPMVRSSDGMLEGVEAVIDKDMVSALLAKQLDADGLIILTDGGGIFENFGKENAREMARATPEHLTDTWLPTNFEKFAGSMGPKVTACVKFVEEQPEGKGIWAAIGDLKDAEEIVAGTEGTVVTKDMNLPVEWRDKGSQSSNLSDKFN